MVLCKYKFQSERAVMLTLSVGDFHQLLSITGVGVARIPIYRQLLRRILCAWATVDYLKRHVSMYT